MSIKCIRRKEYFILFIYHQNRNSLLEKNMIIKNLIVKTTWTTTLIGL